MTTLGLSHSMRFPRVALTERRAWPALFLSLAALSLVGCQGSIPPGDVMTGLRIADAQGDYGSEANPGPALIRRPAGKPLLVAITFTPSEGPVNGRELRPLAQWQVYCGAFASEADLRAGQTNYWSGFSEFVSDPKRDASYVAVHKWRNEDLAKMGMPPLPPLVPEPRLWPLGDAAMTQCLPAKEIPLEAGAGEVRLVGEVRLPEAKGRYYLAFRCQPFVSDGGLSVPHTDVCHFAQYELELTD